MRTTSLAALVSASVLVACQAFTGTGDLEVQGAGLTTSGAGPGGASSVASTTSAVGGQGGAGANGSGGAGGAGQPDTSSSASSMMEGSRAASSGTGGGCFTCIEALTKTGDPSTICTKAGEDAYIALNNCVCGNGAFGSCYDGTDAYGCVMHCGFGTGIPAGPDCAMCAMNSCSTEYYNCVATG